MKSGPQEPFGLVCGPYGQAAKSRIQTPETRAGYWHSYIRAYPHFYSYRDPSFSFVLKIAICEQHFFLWPNEPQHRADHGVVVFGISKRHQNHFR